MGAVCAVVYLLVLIVFIPFAFYKDIVAATSGGGNRDVVIEVQHIETGRFLHRFPHGKVSRDSAQFPRLFTTKSSLFSSLRTSLVCSLSNASSSWELAMIFSTFAGGTKS